MLNSPAVGAILSTLSSDFLFEDPPCSWRATCHLTASQPGRGKAAERPDYFEVEAKLMSRIMPVDMPVGQVEITGLQSKMNKVARSQAPTWMEIQAYGNFRIFKNTKWVFP